MKEFITVSFNRPLAAFTRIFKNKKKVAFSFLLLIIVGILYTFTVIMGYKSGYQKQP